MIIEKAKLHNDIDYSMYKVAKGDLQYHYHYYYHDHQYHLYYHHYHRYYSLSIINTIIHPLNHNITIIYISVAIATATVLSLLLTFNLSTGYDHPFSDTIRILSIIQIISCKEEYGEILMSKKIIDVLSLSSFTVLDIMSHHI
jgi:hypothetical protein